MGMDDPYPRANALLLKNGAKALDAMTTHDISGFESWNNETSLAFSWGSADSRFERILNDFYQRFRQCSPIDRSPLAAGVQFSTDIADFPVPLSALQAALRAKGILFAPFGTEQWKVLKWTGLYSPEKGVVTKIQGFVRVVSFLSTGDIRTVRKAMLRAAEARGYEDTTPPNGPGWLELDHVAFLKQPVVGAVNISALMSIDPASKANAGELPGDVSCLITDKQSKTFLLHTVKPGTNRSYQIRDLSFGYIAQFSPIPLGKDTEPFTNAHVNARIEKERKMSPQQTAARRKEVEDRVYREKYQNAPGGQKFTQNYIADMERLKRNALAFQQQIGTNGQNWASEMKKTKIMPPDWVDERAAELASGAREGIKLTEDISNHLRQRHQELMQ